MVDGSDLDHPLASMDFKTESIAIIPTEAINFTLPLEIFRLSNPPPGKADDLIPTRRVSEGFCGIARPSLTLRVVMFPSP